MALAERTGYDGFGLLCPECDSMRLKVLSTRHHQGNHRRRRECVACKHRFSTIEVVIKSRKTKSKTRGKPK